MAQLIYGFGVNDSDYKVHITKQVNGKTKVVWFCPFYRKWIGLIERCYGQKNNKKRQNYIGCTICDEWRSFMEFREWMSNQDWEGKHIDKDLLYLGNKIYCPDKCVFVSKSVNNFLTDARKARGKEPVGVYFDKSINKYISRCSDPDVGHQIYLGCFDSASAAFIAWYEKKNEIASILSERESDKRIKAAINNCIKLKYGEYANQLRKENQSE